MNPLPILLAVLLAAGGFAAGWKAQSDHRDALELAEAQGKAAALEATARELAKLDIKQVTIRQRAETITRENTVYAECKNPPEMVELINQAAKGDAK